MPLFLDQLVEALGPQPSTHLRVVGGPEPEPAPAPTKIGRAAALHGAELLRLGYSLDQVVHDYGDVCQAIAELAIEKKMKVSAEEFRILNGCLDNAIAEAVTAYGNDRDDAMKAETNVLQESQSFSFGRTATHAG